MLSCRYQLSTLSLEPLYSATAHFCAQGASEMPEDLSELLEAAKEKQISS